MAKLTSVSLNGNSSDVADAYSKSETDTLLAGKQATLTPGSGINISSNNVISATGGGSVELFDTLFDQEGNIRTGGAVTPTGVLRSQYTFFSEDKEFSGVKLGFGELPDGWTTPGDKSSVAIGMGVDIDSSMEGEYNSNIAIGHKAKTFNSYESGDPPVGYEGCSIAVGAYATVQGSSGNSAGGVAIGSHALVRNTADLSYLGGVALGGASYADYAEVSVGHRQGDPTPTGGTYASDYRRQIVNVSSSTRPDSAVTKQQLDAAIAALQAQIDALRS